MLKHEFLFWLELGLVLSPLFHRQDLPGDISRDRWGGGTSAYRLAGRRQDLSRRRPGLPTGRTHRRSHGQGQIPF